MLNLDNKDRQIADLEKQLVEKEKTIKEINKAYIETYKREREKDKEIANIRHQVCEEIRNKSTKSTEWEYETGKEKLVAYLIPVDILDQIEGENDERL